MRSQLNTMVSLTSLLILIPLVAFGFVFNIGGCSKAFGCSCVEPKPPAEALEESKSVFSGKVIEINANQSSKSVTFDVDKAWKGITRDRVTAGTPSDSAACGYEFEEGKEYLIYSHVDEERLEVIICSRTQPLETATADLIVLGEGYQPTQVADEHGLVKVRTIVPLFSMPVIIGIGAAIAGIIAFVSIRKYRKGT